MKGIIFLILTSCYFTFGTRGENAGCPEESLVGRNNLNLPDSSYTASSYYNEKSDDDRNKPSNAKLNGPYGWTARDNNNPDDYLQIDLGTPRVITAVETQGNGFYGEWVKTYNIHYTDSLESWTAYTENHADAKLFVGNKDSNSVKKNVLAKNISARYIRFLPVDYNIHKTMRVNVYVAKEPLVYITSIIPKERSMEVQWSILCTLNDPIKQFIVKAGNRTFNVSSNRRSYTIENLKPYTDYEVGIMAVTRNGNRYWSERKKRKTKMAAPSVPVNAQGKLTPAKELNRPRVHITWDRPRDPNGIISKYTIVYYYNMDTSNTKTVTISGTSNLTYTVVVMSSGVFSFKISAHTRVQGPYASGGNITIPEYSCSEYSLVGNDTNLNIPDSSYTASSYFKSEWYTDDDRYKPSKAKLYGPYGWAANNNYYYYKDYLQIDLGTPRVITAVATQGSSITRNNEWVTKYKIMLANDFMTYKSNNFKHESVFEGNKDPNSVVRHDFKNPITARYIRFIPLGFHNYKTMRVNVYVSIQEAPRVTLVVPGQRSMKLNWTVKSCSPTHPIKGYVVRLANKTGIDQVNSSGMACRFTDLKPYTEYNVSVRAINEVGYGGWSNVTTTRTAIAEPETIPTNLTAAADSPVSISLNWQEADGNKVNGPFKGYKIKYTPQGGKTKTIEVGKHLTTYTLTSLHKYTNYSITIAVRNTKYIGSPSTERRVRTWEDAPSAPENLKASLTYARNSLKPRIVITWDKPRHPNGVIRKYTIVYYYSKDTSNKTIVTIKGASELRYIINTTKKGMLFYNVSATTIKEGPSAAGPNIDIPSHVKSRRKAEENASSYQSLMIPGVVAGIIFLLLVLIIVFTTYKCRNRNQKRRPEVMVMDQVPQSLPLPAAVDASASDDNAYSDVPVIFAKRSSDIEINAEDNTYEETEHSVPDILPAEPPPNIVEVKFVAPDENKLEEEFKNIPVEPRHETKMAKRPANKSKNRYKNIVAYDHSLVTLNQVNDDPDSCYINGSFIRGYDGTPAMYVATQGPLNNTLGDFWRMIWDHDISSIIMLTNLIELGKRKCHQYWPDKNSASYSDITVTNHKTEVFADFVVRTFFLSKADMLKRKVLHFHFTNWPDKGVPFHATAALAFRRKVLAMSAADDRPPVIHCSAGVGRTGTYIMIDSILRQAHNEQQTLDIAGYLHAIRDDRPYMVQTLEQYIFVNMAIHEDLTCGNTEIQAHNLRITMQQLSTVDKHHKLTGYALEFQRLQAVTSQNTQESFDVGLTNLNTKKNRYSNIVATNESRVILNTDETDDKAEYVNTSTTDWEDGGKGDYINASFVHTYREHNAFIMTQAPMENTIADFWRMVMDYEIGTIVMLNKLKKECESFPQYWPKHGSQTYGDVTVKLAETKDMRSTITRKFEVAKQGTRRRVWHLQTLTWENKCIPADPLTVLYLIEEVQKSQQKSGNSPIVVQCSNGVGRSGTFCAIASCLERVKQEQVLDVFQTIKSIRVNRPGAVETLTQYVFCYNTIQKYLDSFSDYANFGDGN